MMRASILVAFLVSIAVALVVPPAEESLYSNDAWMDGELDAWADGPHYEDGDETAAELERRIVDKDTLENEISQPASKVETVPGKTGGAPVKPRKPMSLILESQKQCTRTWAKLEEQCKTEHANSVCTPGARIKDEKGCPKSVACACVSANPPSFEREEKPKKCKKTFESLAEECVWKFPNAKCHATNQKTDKDGCPESVSCSCVSANPPSFEREEKPKKCKKTFESLAEECVWKFPNAKCHATNQKTDKDGCPESVSCSCVSANPPSFEREEKEEKKEKKCKKTFESLAEECVWKFPNAKCHATNQKTDKDGCPESVSCSCVSANPPSFERKEKKSKKSKKWRFPRLNLKHWAKTFKLRRKRSGNAPISLSVTEENRKERSDKMNSLVKEYKKRKKNVAVNLKRPIVVSPLVVGVEEAEKSLKEAKKRRKEEKKEEKKEKKKQEKKEKKEKKAEEKKEKKEKKESKWVCASKKQFLLLDKGKRMEVPKGTAFESLGKAGLYTKVRLCSPPSDSPSNIGFADPKELVPCDSPCSKDY